MRAAPVSSLSDKLPTLGLLAITYAVWILATLHAGMIGVWLAVPILALALTQHSSLQHEIIHGRPFSNQALNAMLVFPALGLCIPYHRFRDMHLAHHHDPALTDPYDDPETNYLDPSVWARLPAALRAILRVNNTLLGRMIFGPFIGLWWLWREDAAAILRGERSIARAYLWHLPAVVIVVAWLWKAASLPVWAYGLACWGALAILRIRTFLEHRAHQRTAARSVIIEDRGPLAILFLNNNFHAVHHAHPNLPWHRLPGEYARRRAEFLRRNGDYRYASYAEVFARYLLAPKDPVAHPLWMQVAPADPVPAPAAPAPLPGIFTDATRVA